MNPALVKAAKSGDVDFLLHLIGQDSFLLDKVAILEGTAETPLHIAAMGGHLPFVQEMLKLRKEFASELNQDGFTPLHLASANGHLQVVIELLKLDSSFCDIQGWDNRLALHCAVVKGRIDVMKELLSASPNSVETKTSRGETVLHLAVKNNQVAAFELLVEHVNKFEKEHTLNEKDNQSNTVLHCAASKKQYQVIRLLLAISRVTKLQVEVNSTNGGGMTPLDVLMLFQSEAGDLEIHETLVEAGAKRGKDLPSASNLPVIDHRQQQSVNNKSNSNNNTRFGDQSKASVFEAGEIVMTALALIATATYQAALSPPGGLWQETDPTHFAGKSVLASTYPLAFFFFIIGNSVGFYASLYAILFLIGSNSNALIRLSMYGISFTYSFTASSITPTDHHLDNFVLVLFLVLGFAGPFVFTKLWGSCRPRSLPYLNP